MVTRPTPADKQVTALVRDATAAPSMHNAQPWFFRYFRRSRTFEIHADQARAMPHSDPQNRGLHIGCGAALLNLEVAAVHEDLRPDTALLPDPTDPALVATVRLTHAAADRSGLGALYPAIHRRHTSRYPFGEREIPDAVREELRAAADAEGAILTFPTAWHLQEVLELAREAEARNATDRGADEDLVRWTRTDAASAATADDGVPHYAFGPRRRGGKAPVRDFAGSRRVPGREAADFEHHPQLALVSTAHNRPEDWLRAGRAVERVLLLATLRGLAGSFATQPLEWSDLRWPLRDPVAGTGYAQTLLRLGYGPQGPGAPRRPVSDVLDVQP